VENTGEPTSIPPSLRGLRGFHFFILFYFIFFFLNDGVPSPIGPIRLIYPKAPRTRIQSKFSATEVPMRLAC